MIRLLLLVLFFFNFLFSNVALKSPDSFILGEPFSFVLEYSGSEEPTFSNIDKIDGFSVQSAGRSNQISIINGRRSQTISQKYVLFANKDFTIPPIEIKTSSKIFKTEAKNIKVQIPSKTNSKDFDLMLSIDKKQLYVGEQAVLTVVFKYRLGQNILNMELNQPDFDGFWKKQLGNSSKIIENGFEIHTLKYLLFPQRSGNIEIKPVSINVAMPDTSRGYDFFRQATKIKKFYSNSINLDIKSLPMDLKLIGDFAIEADIDKQKVKLGEAVSFKVKVSGNGNLDDLEDIKLNIPNATIYENKPIKEFEFKDGKYVGVYTKTFSIVADSSFGIESIKLEYFDSDTKVKKLIQTKEYKVEVYGSIAKQEEVVLQKAKPQITQTKEIIVKETSLQDKILFFIFGFICSLLLIFILYYFKREKNFKKEDEKPLIKIVKSCKSKRELLKKLSPYILRDNELDQLVYRLEMIEDKDFKNIKKEIISKIKRLEI